MDEQLEAELTRKTKDLREIYAAKVQNAYARIKEKEERAVEVEERARKLEAELEEMKITNSSINSQLDECSRALVDLRRLLSNSEKENERLHAQNTAERTKFEAQNRSLKDQIDRHLEQERSLRLEIRLLMTGKLNEAASIKEEYEAQVKQLQEKLHSQERMTKGVEATLGETLSALEQRNAQLLDELESSKAKWHSERISLEQSHSSESTRLKTEIESLQEEVKNISQSYETRLESLSKMKEDLEDTTFRLGKELERVRFEADNTKIIFEEKEKLLSLRQETLEKREGALTKQLNSKKEKHKAKVEQLKAEFSETIASLRHEIDRLRNEAQLRELEFEGDIKHLERENVDLQQQIRVKDFESARQLKNHQQNFTISTRSLEEEARKLRLQLEMKQMQNERLSEENKKHMSETEHKDILIRELRARIRDSENGSPSQIGKEGYLVQNGGKGVGDDSNDLADNVKNLQMMEKLHVEELRIVREENNFLRSRIQSAEDELSICKEEVTRLRKERDDFQQTISHFRNQQKYYEDTIANLESQITETKTGLKNYQSTLHKLRAEIVTIKKERDQLAEIGTELRSKLTKLEDDEESKLNIDQSLLQNESHILRNIPKQPPILEKLRMKPKKSAIGEKIFSNVQPYSSFTKES